MKHYLSLAALLAAIVAIAACTAEPKPVTAAGTLDPNAGSLMRRSRSAPRGQRFDFSVPTFRLLFGLALVGWLLACHREVLTWLGGPLEAWSRGGR